MGEVINFPVVVGEIELSEIHEAVKRRTDDIGYNVKYLAKHIVDVEQGLFDPQAEADVMEQNLTDIGEADIHLLGTPVYQTLSPESWQYTSLEVGSLDNAQIGLDAVDTDDAANHFEWWRRMEEVEEEFVLHLPNVNEKMRQGAIKFMVSAAPTKSEADAVVANGFGYDDRTMLRFQEISEDGLTKTMRSFNLFDIPAAAWAAYFGDRYGAKVEPTAIAIMRFCNQLQPEQGQVSDLLSGLVEGVKKYVDEESANSLDRQLEGFLYDQDELAQHAQYYAKERLDFQKALALSLADGWARPEVEEQLRTVWDELNAKNKDEIMRRRENGGLKIDDTVINILAGLNTIMTSTRAGLAARNERTIKRAASKLGLDGAIAMAENEQLIQEYDDHRIDSKFLRRRTEQFIAEAGLGCGGGCSVSVVDMFSGDSDMAEEAGLSGTLYESEELNDGAKCSCPKSGRKAKVISDGANVVCTNCGDFNVNGRRGSLKTKAA